MSEWYKMNPSKWDHGTALLTLEQEAAYLRIVNSINHHDAPVPHVDRVLAGMFRCSTRKARSLLQALLDAEKVYIEDGSIWNDRARSDTVRRQLASVSMAERGAKGGRVRAERASKSLKTNKPPQAPASSRIEENRIDKKKVTKVTQNPAEILSEIVPTSVAENFVAFRIELKKPMTDRMASMMVKQLHQHHNPAAVLENSIANGYQGIFPDKIKPNGYQNGKPTSKANANGDATVHSISIAAGMRRSQEKSSFGD